MQTAAAFRFGPAVIKCNEQNQDFTKWIYTEKTSQKTPWCGVFSGELWELSGLIQDKSYKLQFYFYPYSQSSEKTSKLKNLMFNGFVKV